MNLLLICASFFGYASEIRALLERDGHRVHWFEDRPSTTPTAKIFVRVAPRVANKWADSFFREQITRLPQEIDEVLVIKGEAVSRDTVELMRRRWPRARFTLYFWDGYGNMASDAPRKVDLFDRAFSFDLDDVREDRRLAYRPLFFLPAYEHMPTVPTDIDVMFVGTAHTDRYAVLRRLREALPKGTRFESMLYMPSSAVYLGRKIFDPSYWKASRREFIFEPLGKNEVVNLIARSKVVVDIERPVQAGFTMRTIEMLAARKKLITTNPNIKRADFYRPTNQLYIDRKDPVVPETFISSDWQPVPSGTMAPYSLRGWVNEVLA